MENHVIREGDIYEVTSVGGHSFMIRYGYYAEEDRHTADPMPIYPCFVSEPKYTSEGHPLITRMQDACHHYMSENGGDGWCADCAHADSWNGQIGICRCKNRKMEAV